MRPEERNPLDLNNLPGEDYSGGYRKKKSGGGRDESGKVYECRFCSLKFRKSQALGGHMNRHRQERETETLNRARRLVFTNDNLIPPTPPTHHLLGYTSPPGNRRCRVRVSVKTLEYLNYCDIDLSQLPISHGGYHHQQTSDPFRSAVRYYCGSSSSPNLPPQSYMYPSPPPLLPYPPLHNYNNPHPINDYFVGLSTSNTQFPTYTAPAVTRPDNNYTCIGAPVRHGFGKELSSVQDNDSNYNCTKNNGAGVTYPDPSMINRYHNGF